MLIALILALGVFARIRKVGPPMVILLGGVVLIAVVPLPTALRNLGDMLRESARARRADTADSGSTPTPTPTPTPHHESIRPPWEWIGFVGLTILTIVLIITIVIPALKKAKRKREEAVKEKARRIKMRAHHLSIWTEILAEEKTLGKRWLSYADDLTLSLRFPIMRDQNEPRTAAVIEAMAKAKTYRTDQPPNPDKYPYSEPFGKAVADFRHALDEAERYARKIRWKNYSDGERKKLRQAQLFLAKALDTTNYPAERKLAYKRVLSLMEDLMIPASADAVLAIEASVGEMLELTSTT